MTEESMELLKGPQPTGMPGFKQAGQTQASVATGEAACPAIDFALGTEWPKRPPGAVQVIAATEIAD